MRRARLARGGIGDAAPLRSAEMSPEERMPTSAERLPPLFVETRTRPGLVEGLMPIVHARTPGALEEERRLLYVAVTRARQHLYLSWSPGRAAARQRSRFLDGIRLGRRGGG